MLALTLLVLSIGLTDSLNPTTVAPAVFLATERHPATRIASFTLGVFAVSFAGGLLVVIGPGQLLLDALPHPGPNAKHIEELISGAILLALAVALWVGRHQVAKRISSSTKRRAGGIGAAFVLGAGIMAVELPTALPYFAAIAAIVASDAALSAQILLLLVFNVAFVTPLLAILAIRTLAGDRASRTLERLGGWLRRQAATFVAALLGLLGAAAIAVGMIGLI